MPHAFLSDEWFAEIEKLRAEVGDVAGGPQVTLNVVVTGAPNGDAEIHIDGATFGKGLIEAPTKVTVPYDVARKLFIDQDQQAAMQAFMQGQIKVEGDMSRLMAMQSAAPAGMQQIQQRLREITS